MSRYPLDPQLISRIRHLVEENFTRYFDLFCQYNMNPELGLECFKTAARQKAELEHAGFTVTESVGGKTGLVGVLKNGEGPTILYRADMDSLPVPDERPEAWRCTDGKTGSQCGHSLHSALLPFVGHCLYQLRDAWRGTALLVAQDGEEGWNGANIMLEQGRLYERFGRPDAALAFHVSPTLPGGTLGVVSGWAMALAQFLTIECYGVGGHGGNPQNTVSPIELAARLVLRFNSVVAREVDPAEVAIISVGAIHGGNKENVIPEACTLKLTVRSRTEAVYRQIVAAIRRVCAAEAAAMGLPEEKFPKVTERPFVTKPLFNDPTLMDKVSAVFRETLGPDKVREEVPYTFAEDFSSFGLDGEVPLGFIWLGSVDPVHFDAAGRPTQFLPGLHHPQFNPHPYTAIRTGAVAMTAAMLALFRQSV